MKINSQVSALSNFARIEKHRKDYTDLIALCNISRIHGIWLGYMVFNVYSTSIPYSLPGFLQAIYHALRCLEYRVMGIDLNRPEVLGLGPLRRRPLLYFFML